MMREHAELLRLQGLKGYKIYLSSKALPRECTQPHIYWVSEAFSLREKQLGHYADHSSIPTVRSRLCRAISPLPYMPS